MKNTVIANRKKGDWEIIKKYFEDRGVDINGATGYCSEGKGHDLFYYGVIDGEFDCHTIKEAQQANATILEVSDIDKEFKVGDVVKVVKPCKTSGNKKGLIGKITEIKEGFLTGFGECIIYEIDGNYYEHISGIELVVSDTVTLPKSFVLEAHKSACSDWKKRIEEVVPELFPKNELIVGNWYKRKSFKDALICFQKINNSVVTGYGFPDNGYWCQDYVAGTDVSEFYPATKQEVFDALKNESIKKNLIPKNLDKIKCVLGYSEQGNQTYFKDRIGKFKLEMHNNQLWVVNGSYLSVCVFDKGTWATLKENHIPDELQALIKKLGKDKIIEIINSN